MMDALQRLLRDREECCAFYKLIIGEEAPGNSGEGDAALEGTTEDTNAGPSGDTDTRPSPSNLNESQIVAMNSWRSRLSLIWGPPGKLMPMKYWQMLTEHDRNRKNDRYGPNSSRYYQKPPRTTQNSYDGVHP